MKPLVIGEAPSRTSDPRMPFSGASGRRLAALAGLRDQEELARKAVLRNVLNRWPGVGHRGEKGSKFPMARARKEAKRITFEGVVILAGKRVAKAFGIIEAPYFEWMVFDRARIAVIPHPSGCSRFWNYPENREVASKFLRTVFA